MERSGVDVASGYECGGGDQMRTGRRKSKVRAPGLASWVDGGTLHWGGLEEEENFSWCGERVVGAWWKVIRLVWD